MAEKNENQQERLAWRPREVAKMLGVSQSVVYQWCATGVMRSKRQGRSVMIPADAVKEFLNDDR